ncbi:hypothetical protein RHMOL_Rhmol07G0023800 [Rhododendron molle]|uniref:Uncharacterized protein n=1 Tax=Rhododendron molle TaxID=49168 RepID=A0ACC0MVY6_RHOML|nr:hypothetical protein RHMOL_Rhmol07G0023800 [Rhododendron molle]
MKQERLQALGVKELQSNPVKMLLMLETLLWRYIAVGGKRDLSVVPVQARATCYNPTGFNCNCTSVNFIPYLPWKFPESEMQLNYLSSSNESPFPDGERMLLTRWLLLFVAFVLRILSLLTNVSPRQGNLQGKFCISIEIKLLSLDHVVVGLLS